MMYTLRKPPKVISTFSVCLHSVLWGMRPPGHRYVNLQLYILEYKRWCIIWTGYFVWPGLDDNCLIWSGDPSESYEVSILSKRLDFEFLWCEFNFIILTDGSSRLINVAAFWRLFDGAFIMQFWMLARHIWMVLTLQPWQVVEYKV